MSEYEPRQSAGTAADRSWQLTRRDWIATVISLVAIALGGTGYAVKQHERLARVETQMVALDGRLDRYLVRNQNDLTLIQGQLGRIDNKIDRMIERETGK